MAEIPKKWSIGPADVYTGPAQQALYLLRENPDLFDATVEAEFEKLQDQKSDAKQHDAAEDKLQDKDAIVLRRRVQEVRESERACIATELMYLKVCNYFKNLQVQLIPPLKGGGDIKLGHAGVNIKALTDIYSSDALNLVKEHLFGILGQQSTPLGTQAIVQIALFQAGQVYAMSAIFGYYLRRVDARYQLEKLAGSFGGFGETAPAKGVKKPFGDDEEALKSLKSYVESFSPEEAQRMTAIASVEAQMAMETQVLALFGDLRILKEALVQAVGMVISNEEATQKLQKAIEEKKVESIRFTSEDLRRVVLEAVAFGSLLYESEKQADSFYELTPSSSRRMGALTGDDDVAGGRLLPG